MNLIKHITAFRNLMQALLGLALSLCGVLVHAATINDVSFQTLPGDRLQIEIKSDVELQDPLSFTINNPARIALDFQNATAKIKNKHISVGVGATNSLDVVSQGGRTRIVLNLSEILPFTVQKNGTSLYVTIENTPITSGGNVNSMSLGNANEPEGAAISHLDFRRGGGGEGRVIISLSDSGMPVNVSQEGNKVIADMIGATIDQALIQRLDVVDFATPAKYIDVTQTEDGVRVAVTPLDSNYEHLAYQSDKVFTLELKPVSKEEQEKIAQSKFGYTGERLSLNFQDIEVRSVLQLIADFTGLNVVVSDSVTGTLTLRLKNVPWDQALDIILKTKGLDKRRSGNVLLIAPAEEIAQQEKISLEAKQQVKELAPLRSEFIQVNYAKAENLAALLSGGEGDGAVISSRGSVNVDQRTNTLLIHDTSESIETARRVVAKLDIPVRQVLIEARIVIANEDFRKQLGARFGITNDSFGTSQTGSGDVASGTLNGTTQALNNETLEMADRLNFNMPVTGTDAGSPGRFGFALAKLPTGSLIELELSALQSEGDGEIVSTPRVITANQKEAFVEQGVEIPYLEASSGGAATVTFKQAVLKLTVTPQITPDENVILDLNVKQDSVGDVFQNIPSINTRELETQVLVKNGETIVLGGIFQHETTSVTTKVPFFADLPIVGRFFRNKNDVENKREILIFVTPKIVRDTLEFN
jgi:type IV pilus assembly protein PilQ